MNSHRNPKWLAQLHIQIYFYKQKVTSCWHVLKISTSTGGCLRQTTAQRKSGSEKDRLSTTPRKTSPVRKKQLANTHRKPKGKLRLWLRKHSCCSIHSLRYWFMVISTAHFCQPSLVVNFLNALWNASQPSHCLAKYIRPQELSYFKTGIRYYDF